MSKQIPQDELNKKKSYRFMQWMKGDVDQYVGLVEMHRQEEVGASDSEIKKHKKDQEKLFQDIYDREHNWVYRGFVRFYKVAAIVSCIALIVMLLVTVSYLPPVGNPDNPAHNEVVEKYIEDGMQDTGAVNIVAGMILDYRAFDTFGESNVLFIATITVLILLRVDKKEQMESAEVNDQVYEPENDIILQKAAFFLLQESSEYKEKLQNLFTKN